MLLFDIQKNQRLASKRSPMFEQNRFAKFLIYFMVAFWAAYFVFGGVMMALGFKGAFPAMEPSYIFNRFMLVYLAVDFIFRFMFQKPPVQEIKPYILMPVSKKKVMSCFCLQSGLSSYNLFWLFMVVPFAVLALPAHFGILGLIGFVLGYWLLFVLNNYWYILWRTFIDEKIYHLLWPLLFYGGLACVEFLLPGHLISTFTQEFGNGFALWSPLTFVPLLAVIAAIFFLNRNLQLHYVYKELGKTEVTTIKHVHEMKFLERYGELGEYMRLEIKLQTRNKVPKKQFIMGITIMLAFSAALAFSEIYDGFMSYFILVYNFVVLGMMTLSSVMSYEGNYLDGLMSRKESVLNILTAKYFLNCLMVLIPFVIMWVPVIEGKISPWAPLSIFFFTTGCLFCAMMQLAVYNKKTINMNMKVMGRNGGGGAIQNVVSFSVMLGPLLLIAILNAVVGETAMYIILLALGLLFTAGYRIWLRNIYNRFLIRRYENMEGFRNSR